MGRHKNLGFMILFFTSREKVQESVSFIPSPSLRLVLHLSPVCCAQSLYSCFILFHLFIFNSQSFSEKKRVSESEGRRQREIRRLQMEVVFFFHVLILPHLNRRCGKALGAPLYIAASLSSKAANRA